MTEQGIKEIILHELIHTLPKCHNHKSEFKYWCSVIQGYLGYDVARGCDNSDINVDYYVANYKHFLYCPKCHKIVDKSNRMTKSYKFPHHYYHSSCHTTCEYASCLDIKEKLVKA